MIQAIYRQMALELLNKDDEHQKMRPRIFIGSSSEAIAIAEEMQISLSRYAQVTLWNNGVFNYSEYTLPSLFQQLDRTDFAVFILAEDDLINSRGKTGTIPRDNVIFELGLFAGRLGLHKTFILHPDSSTLKLPTDLLGITTARYRILPEERISDILAPIAIQIRNLIFDKSYQRMISWNEYIGLINILIKKLKRPSGRGGFSFDICVGISRGGIIAADLIARHYGLNIPVACLWADLHIEYPQKIFAPPKNWINERVIDILRHEKISNILLVDDINRSGQTMELAKACLFNALPMKRICSASLIVDHKKSDHVDYFAAAYDTQDLQLPYYELG